MLGGLSKLGEVLIRHYFYALIIFSFFVMGSVSLVGILREGDSHVGDSGLFDEFNQTFNKIDSVTADVEAIQDSIENSDSDWGIWGVLNALIQSAWQTLKGVFSSLEVVAALFTGMTVMFGVPSWVGATALLLLTVVIAFGIYGLIFQKET